MSENLERGTKRSQREKKQYRAFGLNIRSEIPLQMENKSKGDWDVDVCLDTLPKEWLDDPRAPSGYVEQEDDNFWFVWSELGVMKIEKSRRITLDPALDLTTNYVHQAIQSAGMGLILHQRGALTLHASAVAIDDGIVGFVGYKGAGKSTTAASFFSRGYPLVTDDLLAIDLASNTDEVYGYPGIPRLRLWPDSVRASLDEDPTQLPRNSEMSDKRLRETSGQFATDKMPLRAIYVLDFQTDNAEGIVIEDMLPRDACIELTRHAYALHYLGNAGVNPQFFGQTTSLASRIPIRKLYRQKSLDAIPAMVDAVLEDVSQSVG